MLSGVGSGEPVEGAHQGRATSGAAFRIRAAVGVVLVLAGVAHCRREIEFWHEVPDGVEEPGPVGRRDRVIAEEVERSRARCVPQVLVRPVNTALVEIKPAHGVVDEVLPAPVQAQFLADLVMLQVLATQADRPR